MLKLKISLSLNCQLKSEDTEYLVGLPLVWADMSLNRWRRWYRRGQEAVAMINNALKVASIGLSAARYGVGI